MSQPDPTYDHESDPKHPINAKGNALHKKINGKSFASEGDYNIHKNRQGLQGKDRDERVKSLASKVVKGKSLDEYEKELKAKGKKK